MGILKKEQRDIFDMLEKISNKHPLFFSRNLENVISWKWEKEEKPTVSLNKVYGYGTDKSGNWICIFFNIKNPQNFIIDYIEKLNDNAKIKCRYREVNLNSDIYIFYWVKN